MHNPAQTVTFNQRVVDGGLGDIGWPPLRAQLAARVPFRQIQGRAGCPSSVAKRLALDVPEFFRFRFSGMCSPQP